MMCLSEELDWNLLEQALVFNDFNELAKLDDGDRRTDATTRSTHGENGDGGDDGVPTGLPGAIGECEPTWMEEAFFADLTAACAVATANEETEDVPECGAVDSTPRVRRLREQRRRRRCARGHCCVYNVRYDPMFADWHPTCSHDCRSSSGGLSGCGTPLQQNSVYEEFHAVFGGNDGTGDHTHVSPKFASYDRWRRVKTERALCTQETRTAQEV